MTTEAKVGAFVLSCCTVITFTVIYLLNAQYSGGMAHYRTYLRYAGGLERGASVLYGGIDVGKVKSIRYRGTGYKAALTLFVLAFIGLAMIGTDMTDELFPKLFGQDIDITAWDNVFGRVLVLIYFGFFVFLWLYTHLGWEKTKPVPERVTTHD